MEKLDELLISHDELTIVCKEMMGIILDNNLSDEMETRFKAAGITPGFAHRATEVEQKFNHERRILMAMGSIQ